jgi:hypothetical protein
VELQPPICELFLNKKMGLQDLKIYAINSGVLAVSFTEIEMLLKVVLLTATIIYTIQKIYLNEKK